MRGLSLVLIGAAVASCSTAPESRSPRAEDHLQRVLAGKVALAPVDCLRSYSSNDMIVIDDGTILFREGGRIYRNDLGGGRCSGLSMGNALLTRQFGGQGLCRGDVAQVLSPSNGMIVGSCVLGDFVPYERAAR